MIMNKIQLPAIGFLIIYLCIISCTDDQIFTIGDNLVEIKGDIIEVDTVSLNTYTVRADSLKTSGYERALTGIFTDGAMGTITASTYFEVSLPNLVSFDEKARFDSVCLVLQPSGYVYGDTTLPFNLQVHKLISSLDNDETTAFYNTSTTSFESEILGTFSGLVKPNAGKNLYVKLSDTFGRNLFQVINAGDEVDSQTAFSEYLKGFALTSGGSSSVLQFNVSDTITVMRLFYHLNRENLEVDFKYYNSSLQYNKIEAAYGDSKISLLKKKEHMLPSSETSNVTYCQGGTGIMTRIEFPYLANLFKTYQAYKILKAQLIIRPVHKTYDPIPLASNVHLYYSNSINDFGSVLTKTDETTINPVISIDNMYNQSSYTYDITDFLTATMLNLKDDAPALLLSITEDIQGYSLQRLIVGDQNHASNPIQLKVTFWKY